jgi:hypothetical protein
VKVKEADVDFVQTPLRTAGRGPPHCFVQERGHVICEDKKARYAVATAQLYAARARVALDQAKLDWLSFLTSYKQVTAPLRRRDHGSPRR